MELKKKKKSRERGMANRIFKMASLNCHKLGKDVERSAGNSNVEGNTCERLCAGVIWEKIINVRLLLGMHYGRMPFLASFSVEGKKHDLGY